MKKKFIAIFASLISSACFASPSMPSVATACPLALPVNNPNFCASFVTSAKCHCVASGLPGTVCNDVNLLYARLMATFNQSLQKVCEYQKDKSVQGCLDDWNCYRLGGTDSHGLLCSSTGKKCS